MPEEQKSPYDDLAKELLAYLQIGATDYYAYRASSFLENIFTEKDKAMQELERELKSLRQWKNDWTPVINDTKERDVS